MPNFAGSTMRCPDCGEELTTVECGNQYYPTFFVCYCRGKKHAVGYDELEYTEEAEKIAKQNCALSRRNASKYES
jgi:hypothetical protein